MKKKKLLSMPALEATEEMLRIAAADRGKMEQIYSWSANKVKVFRHDLYFRSAEQDGILKVAVFLREDLKKKETKPRYEIYFSKEEEKHLTYLPETGKWSESCLSRQYLGVSRYYNSKQEDWEEPGANGLVSGYLDYSGKSIYQMIDRYQSTLADRKLRSRHQREIARIDAAMELVPPLPSDWEDWIYRSAYINDMYLFYRYGENRAWCTSCGKEVELKKKVKDLQETRCPLCHAKVTALSWRKRKSVSDRKYVGILQELKDRSGYVLRIFESRITRYPETDWKVSTGDSGFWEEKRFFLSPAFARQQEYEYAHFKNRYENETRWCFAVPHGYYEGPSDECILYHRNLKRLRRGTALKYMPIETLYAHNQGFYTHGCDQLYALSHRPEMEYLIKAKMFRLAWSLTVRGLPGRSVVDWTQKKPWKALRVDREQFEMCVSMDITEYQLRTLQKVNSIGIRLSRQQLEWYARELGGELTQRILLHGHPEKMKKYISGIMEAGARAVDYIDYLDDVEYLRIPPTEDVIFPKNFQSAHLRLAEQRQEKKDRAKKAEMEEKDRMLREMLPELSEIYSSPKQEEYLMVIPQCKEDFNREGRENHNCVGGSYFDKMIEGKCVVLFLRRKSEPDKAFCTVEMNGSRVVQCRAVRNSQPPQEVTAFMETYSREVARRIIKKAQKKTRVRVPAI